MDAIMGQDPELYSYMQMELKRQRESLEMIPSENFTSLAVMEACGSVLTNKYSEGYPKKRYYGGNEFIDSIETLAIERAKRLFGVPYANVQPYSGSPANLAIHFALCKAGDPIMGLNLPDGGHLTHGWKTSETGILFESVPYHVNADGAINIGEAHELAKSKRPKIIWIGATAYTRALPFKEFSAIADSIGAYLVADISHISGLVVAGEHESPMQYAHVVMTTTHKTLRGPRGAIIMVTEKGIRKDPSLAEKMDKAIFPGMQGGPHDHTTAGIAVALAEASMPEFKAYARQVVLNAKALADALKSESIQLVSGGTDNHMVLVDLTNFGKGNGMFVQDALDSIGITVNKNTIPGEPSSPFYPSGIRLGTPAITTRGMKENEMKQIGGIIAEVVKKFASNSISESKDARNKQISEFKSEIAADKRLTDLRKKVIDMCKQFPLYPELGR